MEPEYAKSADVADVFSQHLSVTEFTGNSQLQTLCRRFQRYLRTTHSKNTNERYTINLKGCLQQILDYPISVGSAFSCGNKSKRCVYYN